MIEARVFTDNLDDARKTLAGLNAENQGRYTIDDEIYRNIDDSILLVDEFLRLRVITENIWNEKPVVLALKQTELQSLGKSSHILLKLQFDTKEEAEEYYAEHLAEEYMFDFSFSRIGWQYSLPNGDIVDLEILEDEYFSIEFKSNTDDGIKRLISTFAINEDDVMKESSVVAFKQALQR